MEYQLTISAAASAVTNTAWIPPQTIGFAIAAGWL